jgi:putative oxidoreductase
MKQSPGIHESVARLLLGSIFLYRAGYILYHPKEVMEQMMSANIPGVPALFVIISTLILLGSLGLVLGYRTKTAAFVLIIITLVEAFILRPPWQEGNIALFLIRISLIGGLMLVMIYGAGKWSFDAQSMVPVRRKRN